jgi:outer membrane lipoprotein-sorting protein
MLGPLKAAALVLCLGSGCAGSLRPTHPISDAKLALERQSATGAGLHAIRAEARVDQRKSGGRIRGTVLMFVEETGRVRFDVMTQFGPAAILTSDGKQFAFSDFRESRFLSGDTCPQNIARLLGVQLTAEETARFLLGGTSVLKAETTQFAVDDDGHYALQLKAATGARQQLTLAVYPSDLALPAEQQRLYLVRSELWDAQGQKIWRVSYDDLESLSVGSASLLVPMRVHIEQSTQNSDTLVHFKKVVANPTLEDAIFVQTPRPGMNEEAAVCE